MDIFISYSSKDSETAQQVTMQLEQNGFKCWIAPRNIKPSELWASAISEALKQVKVMVLLFSDNANQSVQVAKELTLAVNNHLMIIPLKISDTLPTGAFEYYLADTQWEDATKQPMKDCLNHISTDINSYLKGEFKPKIRKVKGKLSFRFLRKKLIWSFVVVVLLAVVSGVCWQWYKSYKDSHATYLQMKPKDLEIVREGDNVKVKVYFDGHSWTVEHEPEWATVSDKTDFFYLICQPNSGNDARRDSVVLRCGNVRSTMIVEQQGPGHSYGSHGPRRENMD